MTDPADLLQVRIGECGCVLLADSKPVGYRFKATGTGDARVPVYCCEEHDKTRVGAVVTKAGRSTKQRT